MDDYNSNYGQSGYGGSSSGGSGSGAGTGAAPMKEQIANKAEEVKDKVADFGRRTSDRIDQSRESAASALERTASTLHSGGDRVSGAGRNAVDRVSEAAHSAADGLQVTADYVRRTDLKSMGSDLVGIVKRYPAYSVAAAVILGFLVARSLGSED